MASELRGVLDASLTAQRPRPAPVAESGRIDAIDTLRGFAIFGIYAVNIATFAWPSTAMADPRAMGDTWWNHAGYQLTSAALFGKFMFLFAMLFGATVVFFDRKTTPTDRKPKVSDGTGLWARRQGVLLAFGFAHALLIWYGDILAPYAVVGFFIAWWLRKLSWKWHVGIGVAAHLIGSSLLAGLFLLATGQSEAGMQQQFEAEVQAHTGDYLGLLEYRAIFLLFFWGIVGPIFALQIGAMMLWGISLARAGILTAQRPTAWYAKAAAVLVPVGAAVTLGVFYGTRLTVGDRVAGAIWTGFGQFVGVPLGLGYAALLVWVTKAGIARFATRALANVGRMGLTNYLLQSVISAVVFYGWGFGFFGEIGYPGLFAIIGGMWAFNVAFSAAWLSVFRIGPVEWLWRALTYWTLPPLLRVKTQA
ncbi:MAG: DUF418 domain-containing protein [Planctomycetota bacterium]